jgi:hypothetical protein
MGELSGLFRAPVVFNKSGLALCVFCGKYLTGSSAVSEAESNKALPNKK